MDSNPVYDAVVIGGGPAGTIAAIGLRKLGRSVIVIEKAEFPRFHIGESFLPATYQILGELGLQGELKKLEHVPKFGAEFAMGYGGHVLNIQFADGYCDCSETFNIERSSFDQMLMREAKKAGAEIRQPAAVKQILKLTDGDVAIQLDSGEEIRGKYLLDASGQNSLVGRHLGTRKVADEPHLRKVAYFSQFDNVKRPPGKDDGSPLIACMDEGWFWMIALTEKKTSVGMVLDPAISKQIQEKYNLTPDRMLQWGIANTPVVRQRMVNATPTEGTDRNQILADFSFRCRPYAGEGHFLIGDAAAFMDPIFSTGVSVAVNSALHAAKLLDKILAGKISPQKARAKYISDLEESTRILFTFIRHFYDHAFRELFLQGHGPMQVHKAAIGLLAGNVFPRPAWKLRWRMWLFDYFVKWNRKTPIVPRRKRFSILKAAENMEVEQTAAM